jgi:hypothetical protein
MNTATLWEARIRSRRRVVMEASWRQAAGASNRCGIDRAEGAQLEAQPYSMSSGNDTVRHGLTRLEEHHEHSRWSLVASPRDFSKRSDHDAAALKQERRPCRTAWSCECSLLARGPAMTVTTASSAPCLIRARSAPFPALRRSSHLSNRLCAGLAWYLCQSRRLATSGSRLRHCRSPTQASWRQGLLAASRAPQARADTGQQGHVPLSRAHWQRCVTSGLCLGPSLMSGRPNHPLVSTSKGQEAFERCQLRYAGQRASQHFSSATAQLSLSVRLAVHATSARRIAAERPHRQQEWYRRTL